jgi:hypothetical protein
MRKLKRSFCVITGNVIQRRHPRHRALWPKFYLMGWEVPTGISAVLIKVSRGPTQLPYRKAHGEDCQVVTPHRSFEFPRTQSSPLLIRRCSRGIWTFSSIHGECDVTTYVQHHPCMSDQLLTRKRIVSIWKNFLVLFPFEAVKHSLVLEVGICLSWKPYA